MARFTTRRLGFSGVLAVAVLILAVGASQGLAGSRGDGSATAPIQYHGTDCGVDTGQRFIGTASFTLKGDILKVSVKMHGADPGQYTLFVYTGGGCQSLGRPFGKFKVDSSGDGEKSVSVDVSGLGRSFFVDPVGNHQGNDSLIVNL